MVIFHSYVSLPEGSSMIYPFKMLIINRDLVGGLEHVFPYIGNNSPNSLIFFRGVETTNQRLFNYHNWWITVIESPRVGHLNGLHFSAY